MSFPGSSKSPIHMTGGLRISNLDALSLTTTAFVFALVRFLSCPALPPTAADSSTSFVIAIAALIVSIIAIVNSGRESEKVEAEAHTPGQASNKED
eukprot:766122-Hanusia_phi.AAC.1